MSFEGHFEYECACGEIDSADAYDAQPSQCPCGKPFVASRLVDQTNNINDYGEWTPITIRSETVSKSDSFCDRVMGEKSKVPDIKTAIADEAKNIVNGARRNAYGKPEDNFERIARFWKAYFDNTGRPIALTASDVSPLMRLMKEARLCETPDHRDSFVDLVGYTLTGAEINGVAA